MRALADDLAANWPLYVAIPLVAALVGILAGYLVTALLFLPRSFVGIGGFLGWQGVVPRYAPMLAAIHAELIASRLVDTSELLERVDAGRLAADVEQPLLVAIDDITRDVLAEHHPGMWESLPPLAQDMAVKQIQAAAGRIVEQLTAELHDNIDTVLDVKHLVRERLAADPELLTRIFREISPASRTVPAWPLALAGLAGGLLTTVLFAVTNLPALLPVLFAVTGLLTTWLAIRLVFEPRRPRTIAGRITVHGSFHRRRAEAARTYADLIAAEVFSPAHLIDALVRGPRSHRMYALILRTVDAVVTDQARPFKPMVTAAVGNRDAEPLKRDAATQALARLESTSRRAHGYLGEVVDASGMVEERLLAADPEVYEELLRPAYRQAGHRLVAAGGLAACAVGLALMILVIV